MENPLNNIDWSVNYFHSDNLAEQDSTKDEALAYTTIGKYDIGQGVTNKFIFYIKFMA